MQPDERQLSAFDSGNDVLRHLRRDVVVPDMPPPNQHVGVVEQTCRQSLLRLIDVRRDHPQPRLLAEVIGDRVAEKILVRLLLSRLLLVPNDDANQRFSGWAEIAHQHDQESESQNGSHRLLQSECRQLDDLAAFEPPTGEPQIPTQVQFALSVAFGHGSRLSRNAETNSLTKCGCEPPWPPPWMNERCSES